MIRNEHHALLQVDEDVEPAGVQREDGWRDIEIRFVTGELTGARTACLFTARFAPGAAHERHTHPHADEIFYVVSGRAAVGAADGEHLATPGAVQFIPAGEVHWLRNVDPVEPVEVVGVYLGVANLDEAGYDHLGDVPEDLRTVT
jgi:quercetin dioxygenase-like cupin family protein